MPNFDRFMSLASNGFKKPRFQEQNIRKTVSRVDETISRQDVVLSLKLLLYTVLLLCTVRLLYNRRMRHFVTRESVKNNRTDNVIPLECKRIHFVQRRGDWAGPQPAQARPRCTKCNSPPINGQCTNHRIAGMSLCGLMCPLKG